MAEAILGRGDEAVALYDSMLPYHQNDRIEVRGAEPYVYVQFVYGRDHEWFGRAQNPWLTGTAGWMYTAITKWVLGVRLTLDGMIVDPCIPHDWDGFEVRRQWRDSVYLIEVTNPDHVSKGVAALVVDGVAQDPSAPIAAQPAGREVRVQVTLG
jgi:N,N'-diacetylchitobiose phosphorylase